MNIMSNSFMLSSFLNFGKFVPMFLRWLWHFCARKTMNCRQLVEWPNSELTQLIKVALLNLAMCGTISTPIRSIAIWSIVLHLRSILQGGQSPFCSDVFKISIFFFPFFVAKRKLESGCFALLWPRCWTLLVQGDRNERYAKKLIWSNESCKTENSFCNSIFLGRFKRHFEFVKGRS